MMTNICWRCEKTEEPNARFCTHCGASLTGRKSANQNLQHKKEKVFRNEQSRSQRNLKLLLVIVAAFLIVGWFYISLPGKTNPIIETQPFISASLKYSENGQGMFDLPVKVVEGKIIVPLDIVKTRKFVSFLYENQHKSVPLLAYISNEGKLVTAVSMCEPCNSKRFHIQGDRLVCNSCGSTWELNNLEAISGACGKYPPDPIPSFVSGNEIKIDEAIVANWQRRI